MNVHHYVTLYLTATTATVIEAVQGDGVRVVAAQLMEGAEPWSVPEGVTAGIGYELPDKKSGYYDQLRDSKPACMIAGNLVTAAIDSSLTAAAGNVKLAIVLRDGSGGQVATFPITMRVAKRPGRIGAEEMPPVSAYEGMLLYGGPGGEVLPLKPGTGLSIRDGALHVSGGGGDSGQNVTWDTLEGKPTYVQGAQEKFDPAWLPDGGFGWEGPGGKTDILPEAELVVDENTQTVPTPDGRILYGYMIHPLPTGTKLTVGEEYTVTINGDSVSTTAHPVDEGNTTFVFLGNAYLLNVGEDTGEDWCFFVQQVEINYWAGMFCTTNTEYKTVSVSARGTVVHTILDKFIPDSIPRKGDIKITWEAIPDKPFGVTVTSLAAPMTLAEMRYTGSYSYGMGFLPQRITAGERYLVSVDGEITEWVAQQIPTGVYLGADPRAFNEPGTLPEGAYSIWQTSNSIMVYLIGDRTQPVIGVARVDIKYIDERVIPDSIARVGQIPEQAQSDWRQNDPEAPDFVKGRTHYEENNQTVIEWDGSTEGRDMVPGGAHYHVSNEIPTVECFVNGVATVTMADGSAQEMPITEDTIAVEENGIFWMGVCVAYVDEAVVSGMTFPKAGTYFLHQDGMGYVSKLTCGSTTIHPLDEKFIPDSIARVGQIPSDDHINDLINTALGVIEHGTY